MQKPTQMLQMMAALTKHWSSTMIDHKLDCQPKSINCFLSTISHLLPAWTWTASTVLHEKDNKPSMSFQCWQVVLSTVILVNFAIYATNARPVLPQIATYFAGIMPVASSYAMQLLCRQIRPQAYSALLAYCHRLTIQCLQEKPPHTKTGLD